MCEDVDYGTSAFSVSDAAKKYVKKWLLAFLIYLTISYYLQREAAGMGSDYDVSKFIMLSNFITFVFVVWAGRKAKQSAETKFPSKDLKYLNRGLWLLAISCCLCTFFAWWPDTARLLNGVGMAKNVPNWPGKIRMIAFTDCIQTSVATVFPWLMFNHMKQVNGYESWWLWSLRKVK